MMPLLKIDYTSTEIKSQIYIGTVNWLLMICVFGIIIIFGASSKLAAAYGFAVTGTMSITGLMMAMIYFYRKEHIKMSFAILVTVIDLCFFAATTIKIKDGGYYSLIIASIPFSLMLIYINGQKKLARTLKLIPLETFLERYKAVREVSGCISGTALYFIRELRLIPPYIVNNMCEHHIIYQDNVFTVINTTNEPFGIDYVVSEPVTEGIRALIINRGYKEIVDVSSILVKLNIASKVIFYGVEEIVTNRIAASIFSAIKRNTPSFVKFYRLPVNKLHGVITRVEM
jgi:KUP system potassium uptake protein